MTVRLEPRIRTTHDQTPLLVADGGPVTTAVGIALIALAAAVVFLFGRSYRRTWAREHLGCTASKPAPAWRADHKDYLLTIIDELP
jgi:hypothetical protein